MNKSDLINAMANDAGVSKAIAKKTLESFLNNVRGSLNKGERISLVGFGSWSVARRSARTGRDPRTGKPIKIKAKNIVKFKPSKQITPKK